MKTYVCMYVTVSQKILLSMRNVSDQRCTDNQKTFYVQ
jgi:hypothetical protein